MKLGATALTVLALTAAARPALSQAAAKRDAPIALELQLGAGAFSRNLHYTDDLFDALRTYELDAAPFVFIEAAWYPLAHGTDGADLAHVGIVGGYEHGFPPVAVTRDGRQFDSASRSYFVGLRGRAPIDRHELGLVGSYGKQDFEVLGDEAAPLVPDMHYGFVRLGAEARFRFDEFLFGVTLGKRFVLGTGALEESAWFPRAGADAVDGRLYVGHAIVPSVDLVAGVELRRYFFSMNPVPTDPRVAGGAVDQYLSGWGAIVWRLPGGGDAGADPRAPERASSKPEDSEEPATMENER
jgi:hypothetical protein